MSQSSKIIIKKMKQLFNYILPSINHKTKTCGNKYTIGLLLTNKVLDIQVTKQVSVKF